VSVKIYNVLDNFIAVSKVPSIDELTIEKIKNLKNTLDVGLVLISCEDVNSEQVLLGLIYNAVSAHKYGYNKLRKLDSELILVLAGKNAFHEAANKVTPKIGGCALIILLSDNKDKIQEAIDFVYKNLGSNLEEAKLASIFNSNDLTLIENFALFYVWYK
jgi:tRNA threonylcarbamoyladenosine modification (KEOPS) complex Cgi121 subunit